MPLPPRFLLYIPSRSTKTDPFSGYILIDSVLNGDGVSEFKVVPSQPPTAAILIGHPNLMMTPQYQDFYDVKLLNGTTVRRRFVPVQTTARMETTGAPIPVIIIGGHSDYVPPRTKRNVHIKWLPGTELTPTPWMDTAHGPVASGYIQHVHTGATATATAAPSHTVRGPAMEPYIARQLLELAQLKHEMCPITAEEFITGETAVMPCGHLFMRMAIEESFKTAQHKCPACRRTGTPTFV